MNRLNKTESSVFVSLICSLLPEDLHSELNFKPPEGKCRGFVPNTFRLSCPLVFDIETSQNRVSVGLGFCS